MPAVLEGLRRLHGRPVAGRERRRVPRVHATVHGLHHASERANRQLHQVVAARPGVGGSCRNPSLSQSGAGPNWNRASRSLEPRTSPNSSSAGALATTAPTRHHRPSRPGPTRPAIAEARGVSVSLIRRQTAVTKCGQGWHRCMGDVLRRVGWDSPGAKSFADGVGTGRPPGGSTRAQDAVGVIPRRRRLGLAAGFGCPSDALRRLLSHRLGDFWDDGCWLPVER